MGCLVIDDLAGRGGRLTALEDGLRSGGVRVRRFEDDGAGDLHGHLQEALLAARGSGGADILAVGAGCGAALALAAQLPVDRLALLELPAEHSGTPAGRALRRRVAPVERFVRRNMALCVSQVLLIAPDNAPQRHRLARMARALTNARVTRAFLRGDGESGLCTNCENALEKALIGFFSGADLQKSLAQNSEMCIIV